MQARPMPPPGQSASRRKIPIRVHPRQNPLAFRANHAGPAHHRRSPPRHPARPTQEPPGASTTPGLVPRHSCTKPAAATRTPRAPDDRQHRCPSPHPAPRPEANPPACQPPRHAPSANPICPPQPVRPENRLRIQPPPGRATHATRQLASARRNPYAQRNCLRTQPRPRQGNPRYPPTRIHPPQPVRPENPHPHPPDRATHTANPHPPAATRAPRETPTPSAPDPVARRQASCLTRSTPKPAYCPLGQDRRSKANP